MPTIDNEAYTKILAGAVFPLLSPGFVVVVGEQKHHHAKNRFTQHFLDEYQSDDFNEFMKNIIRTANKYKIDEVVYNVDQVTRNRIQQWRDDNYLYEKQLKTLNLVFSKATGSQPGGDITLQIDQIRADLKSQSKRLFFGEKQTMLPGLLQNIPLVNDKIIDTLYPGPAALGYVNATLHSTEGYNEDMDFIENDEHETGPVYTPGRYARHRVR